MTPRGAFLRDRPVASRPLASTRQEQAAMQGEPSAAQARRTIDTARGAIALREAPNPAAPPLVLLHGIGSRAESWWPVLDPLAARFHLYALDLRGHGGSQ
jgi:alpha-beta hydrolase superfamily lysophospholipase